MINNQKDLVIFQNYFSPYRHKLFIEIAKSVSLTVIYMQTPEEEGRKWDEQLFSTGKNYETIQLKNKRLFSFKPFNQVVWVTGLSVLKEAITPESKVIFLDNMPTNFTSLRIMASLQQLVPRKNRILWNEHISPTGSDSWLKSLYKKAMTMLLALRVDTILSFSSMNTEYLKTLGIPLTGQKIVRTFQTTYTKAEIEEYAQAQSNRVGQQKLLTFGFLGYFSQRKGIVEFLNAIKYYRNAKARFLFVGAGPLQELISQSAKKDSRIELKPYATTEEEKTEFFNRMSINVVPSEKDPWCVVVNEAACRGVPSIVSPYVGAQELVTLIDKSLVLPDNQGVTLAKYFSEIQRQFEDKNGWEKLRQKTIKIAALWNIEQAAIPFIRFIVPE